MHYEENTILKVTVLGIKSMENQCSSGFNIKSKLSSLLEEFGISDLEKIKFVTDRGSNVKSALQNNLRLNCSNHLLSNIVETAFSASPELEEIVDDCKKL